jgi:hypothetical protein
VNGTASFVPEHSKGIPIMKTEQLSDFLLCGATVLPPFLLQADEFFLALACLVFLLVAGCLVVTLDPNAPFRHTPASKEDQDEPGA